MPPAALHHLVNASATSKNSCSRPGAAAAPGSAIVPIWIELEVRPRPLPPVAWPGPQMAFSDPKSPAAEALGVLLAEAVLLWTGAGLTPVGTLLDRPHAPTSATRVVAPATATRRVLRPPALLLNS